MENRDSAGLIPEHFLKRGFTLVELLVVIAIIAILAGLVFPALRRAQAKSRQASCMNTLHQFGVGIIQYRHDHDDKMPPWLSALYPDYISSKTIYVCPSDKSRGRDGSKPEGMPDQFKETDDIESNTASNRNQEIRFCSYMYEYCDTECDPDGSPWWKNFLGPDGTASTADLDDNGDGIVTWAEVKEYQLRKGDKSHPGPYNETDFPTVRCYHHINEKEVRAKAYDNMGNPIGYRWEKMTLNLSYSGNVFPAPLKWEDKL